MKKNILVLGAGQIGTFIVSELAKNKNYRVVVLDMYDVSECFSSSNVECHWGDVSDMYPDDLQCMIPENESFDLAFGCLPSWHGCTTMDLILSTKIPRYVDISFTEEDPVKLFNKPAKKNKIRCITDMGFAPGLSNILVARLVEDFPQCKQISVYAGGLPKETKGTLFKYRAGFSPSDVLAEYLRPARVLENGKIVTKPAMSDLESFAFPSFSHKLEAFTTDGLRSLIRTLPKERKLSVVEKTVRYPGHAAAMSVLKEAGFFSEEKVSVKPSFESITDWLHFPPIAMTENLLFPRWQFKKGEKDFSVLYIVAKDARGEVLASWSLLDEYKRGFRSMSRMTGYPALIAGEMMLKYDEFIPAGVHPPEAIGQWYCNEFLCKVESKVKLRRVVI